jgi:hypothetical protein
MSALRSGIGLLASTTLSAGQEISSAGTMTPDPAQGSVDNSGKFVPASLQGEILNPPKTLEEWKNSASQLIEKTGEHTFRVGIVQCDRATRTLTIPAQVNAREGLIEYALVTRQGKIHEALLATDAAPMHVQMAALLLGMAPQPGSQNPTAVMIEVEWATNGPMRKLALADLMTLANGSPENASDHTMARGSWNFTGSQIDARGFAAAREGSLVALIEDPAALIVNPRPGRHDDSLHLPNAAVLPGIGTPVSVRIHLQFPDAFGKKTPAKP